MRRPREEAADVVEHNGVSQGNCVVEPVEDPTALHERLVSYVHALNGDVEPRSGVWMEHSYARARGANNGVTPSVIDAAMGRSLLVRRPRHKIKSPPLTTIDVESVDAQPPKYPDPPPELVNEPDIEEDDWEVKLDALAPTQLCKKVVVKAVDVLKSLRLSRLCGAGGARDETRSHARRLRRILAPLWAGPASTRPAIWLHSALLQTLPTHYLHIYEDILAELRLSIPRLCERLNAVRLPPPAPEPCAKPGPAVMPMSSRPLLVWIGSGRDRHDARWERRLRALVPTHFIKLHNAESRPPEAWCAAAAAAARASLAALDTTRDACSLLALGGAGAGAALAVQLAMEDKRVAALLLLAPPLNTPEGIRDTPDDPLSELRIPCLTIVPECGSTIWWDLACVHASATTKLLLVGGADDDLNMSHRTRRALRLPQHALDAAIVDECARWLNEVTEGGDFNDNSGATPPAPKKIKHSKLELVEDIEYAHLPQAMPRTKNNNSQNHRAIEIVEGRVVSRVSGGQSLTLTPRSSPQPLATADIMNMPIVFADDEEPLAAVNTKPATPKVNVKSGSKSLKYTKVIVAKRGARAGGGSGPIVVRGGMRLIPRASTGPR